MTDKKRNGQEKLKSGAIGGALALTLTLSSLSPAAAIEAEASVTRSIPEGASYIDYLNVETGKIEYKLPGITTRNVWQLSTRSITVNGKKLANSGFIMNDTLYLPLDAYANALGNATVRYDKATRTATLTMSGLVLTATDGGFVTYANDRPLFSFSPNVLMSNGKMYIPASALTKATGTAVSSQSSWSVTISGSYKALTPASKYYRQDEVYWLSKIISAEAKGESLIGQIAVGDVIMNRVKSSQYPNTIYGVIFDRKYGVQFSPTLDGSIYRDPTYTATLAAKICLEGTSLSDNALFFLNPKTAESNWIVKSREYAYTIGGHDFYL